MADTMQFDLVSPERSLASLTVSAVDLPGSEGDMTAMPDHTPMITSLKPGIVRVTGPEGEVSFIVSGGFAEVTAGSATVLAERAHAVEDVTQEVIDSLIADVTSAHENATDEQRDVLAHHISALEGLAITLGLNV